MRGHSRQYTALPSAKLLTLGRLQASLRSALAYSQLSMQSCKGGRIVFSFPLKLSQNMTKATDIQAKKSPRNADGGARENVMSFVYGEKE